MGLIGDIAGAFGISKTGILAGALKMVGVPDKMAHAIGLAAELSRGITKDGFDWDKINKGALARHGMKAFGIDNPMAILAGTAALKIGGSGFAALAGSGGAMVGMSAIAGGSLAATALGSLSKMQLGIGTMLAGAMGVAGLGPNDLANGAFAFLGGDNKATLRGLTGQYRTQGGVGSAMASLPRPCFFEDLIAALMIDHLKDQQDKIEEKAKDLLNRSKEADKASSQAKGMAETGARQVPGGDRAADAAKSGTSESRNIEFEMIKNEIQKLSQMQQALSNVLNTMHEQAMGAIRHIKA
jgi:hypothetical protein